jgi:hypothetical protein
VNNTPKADAGQYELFSASWSGGLTPYSANYIIINSHTGAVLASQLYTDISTTSNTFVYQIPSEWAGNTITANVVVTDSAPTPTTKNSVKTAAITISTALTASTASPGNQTVDRGRPRM